MRSSTSVLIAFVSRVVAQHCAATLPSRRAAGVQASGGFSGAEKATPSSRSSFTRNGVCLFGWKPLDARRGQRPKPSERRLQPPKCCTTPTTGCSPCAADCTGRLTVGMTRDFADGEARPAAASHTCGTSGVLAVKYGTTVRTGCAHELTRCDPYLDAPRRGRPVPAPGASGAAAIEGLYRMAPGWPHGDEQVTMLGTLTGEVDPGPGTMDRRS